LSGVHLHGFVAGWLAFVECNLEDVSFRDTDFTFRTAFMRCFLKGTDFTGSFGGDDLFYECDLRGAVLDTSNHWASVDLDNKKVPSYFVNCLMDKELRDFLVQDGNLVTKSEAPPEIQQRLAEIAEAQEVNI
jgi:uncharacterized protein YjbI with pentapeptide repeats